jgi:hypothetical protein
MRLAFDIIPYPYSIAAVPIAGLAATLGLLGSYALYVRYERRKVTKRRASNPTAEATEMNSQ